MFLSFTIGLSVSTGIEIGKNIPNRSNDYIFEDAKISIISSFLMSFLISMLLLISKDLIFKLFNLNKLIIDADIFFYIMIFSIFIKSLSIQLMNGVIRAGGDGLFCLRCDFIFQWLFTLPLVLYLNSISMSVIYIYSIVLIEEFLKLILSIFRFNSGKWLHNLAA
ncbi:MATE family efflux transporter [Vibrio chagasii]